MVETRLRSNSNNIELHEAGNACWVLHSNHLTDSNDSRIFLRKTRESEMRIKVPKELTHGPFAVTVDTESLMLPGLILSFLTKRRNKPVFSVYNLLPMENFYSA